MFSLYKKQGEVRGSIFEEIILAKWATPIFGQPPFFKHSLNDYLSKKRVGGQLGGRTLTKY